MTDEGSFDLSTPEGMLLAACAGASLAGPPDDGQWVAFAQRAEAMRVGAAIWSESCSSNAWPTPARVLLAEQHRRNSIRNLRLRFTLIALDRACQELGVAYCLLKGAALMVGVYSDPGARVMRDIDMLLSRHDARALHTRLQTQGWFIPPGIPRDEDPDGIHLPVLIEETSGFALEVHFHVGGKAWKHRRTLAKELLDEARTLPCLTGKVSVAAAAPLLAHVLVHAVSGQLFDTGPQLLCDVRALLADALLGEAAHDALRRYELTTFGGLVEAVANRYGQGELGLADAGPWKSDDISVAQSAWLMLAPPERKAERRMALAAAHRRSWPSRMIWLTHGAFGPSAEALAELSGRTLDDPARWLAYPRWILTRAATVMRGLRDQGLAQERAVDARLRGLLFSSQPGDRAKR